MWVVYLLEYERGWGSRVEGKSTFGSYEEALKFFNDFNARNTKQEVPDWYMIAEKPVYVA